MDEKIIVLPKVLPPEFKGYWKDGLSDKEYHADKTAISSTALRLALRSGRAFYRGFVLDFNKKDTPAMKLGRIAHMALLEPERFKKTFVVQPKFVGYTQKGELSSASKEAKDKANLWLANLAPDAQIMTQDEQDKLMFMIEALLEHPVAVNLIKDAAFEQSGYFRDPVTGLAGRIRTDILRKDLSALPDFKTAKDASRDAFARDIWFRKYHIQLAFYSHGIEHIHGRRPDLPCFIVVENQAPYDVCVYPADDGMMDRGYDAVRRGFDRIKACLDKGVWSGMQPNGSENISLPTYTDWLEE